MNPRSETIAEGIVREMIAENTYLFYNPESQAATVRFQSRPHLFQNEKWLSIGGDWYNLDKTVYEIAPRKFGEGLVDPVTDADLSNVSVGGIVLLIKAAYAALYDEAYAIVAASTPAVSGSEG
ncbi:hypothetical protein J2X57_001984 [Luteibacter sp. 1214]|uniref:hypothetical protein n=1 Tax=Luteibacter sp. 1214 TaxID=2817735 RepID=UPI00285DE2F3|nr:hypothetical protein [Luteibacter sp. 1214]MDR6642772.1 hypothetical protein [Luteibacter sp. 1214]